MMTAFFFTKKNGHEFYHLGGVLVALKHRFGFHRHLGHNTNTNLDQKYIFDDLTGLEQCSVKSNQSPKNQHQDDKNMFTFKLLVLEHGWVDFEHFMLLEAPCLDFHDCLLRFL